jgi:hypothetical protein
VRNSAGRSKYSPQQGCAAAPGSRTRATDMLFSSLPFVCLFLPVVLAVYFALPKSSNNVVLVAASIAFYAWDDPLALAPIGCSILINFATARALRRLDKEKRRRLIGVAIAGNLAVLIVYKYTSFLFETANELLAFVSGPGLPRALATSAWNIILHFSRHFLLGGRLSRHRPSAAFARDLRALYSQLSPDDRRSHHPVS